ncbi:MAG: HEAT repeat domain-containing protein [Legionella longbeachae]|nr:HEAT repeat domain-containing protein [Legionella longbeachae]
MRSTNLNKTIDYFGDILNNKTAGLPSRCFALDVLGAIAEIESVNQIVKCLDDRSELLKHKAIFRLGQIAYLRPETNVSTVAHETLCLTLGKMDEHLIVRHEAGEMLGGLGLRKSLPVLKKFLNDPIPEISETCELAIRQIEYIHTYMNGNTIIPHGDAAPSYEEKKDIKTLEKIIFDCSENTWERFRAMFTLRNFDNDETNSILINALDSYDNPLLGHDIAFVLLNVPTKESIDVLYRKLSNDSNDCIVRHVCAEALGEMKSKKANDLAREFLLDKDVVIRESVEVALHLLPNL